VRRAERAGLATRRIDLPASTTTERLVAVLTSLSADPEIDGILLQHPVPPQVDERAAFEAIAVDKDVDGVTFSSFARMAEDSAGFASATPGGILRLLEAYGVDLQGIEAVVVGQGPILGRPLSAMLTARGATVTSCHVLTRDLRSHVERAELLVAAVGRAGLIPGENARLRARLITPVPGGVGPMTIATLLDQTVDAWRAHVGA
jgi:methylenetetrahydrofolate dehydrogenase (NADP+)/methenyltetrahydrofolate cyclohydrolase